MLVITSRFLFYSILIAIVYGKTVITILDTLLVFL